MGYTGGAGEQTQEQAARAAAQRAEIAAAAEAARVAAEAAKNTPIPVAVVGGRRK